jgi:hypothetical protein
MDQQTSILNSHREAVSNYHTTLRRDITTQKHRDPFIRWFTEEADTGPLDLRVLIILVNTRFDQKTFRR